ncbi:hypothetical protein [Comamonas serinivorans]|nr:hypothetical protein [Comamonas serinivorans]
MPHAASTPTRDAGRTPFQALGVLVLAWLSSWNSLACDPEVDIHLYPFF